MRTHFPEKIQLRILRLRKQYSDLKKKEGAFAGEAGRKNQCYKADDIKLGIRRDCAEPGAINSLIKAIRHKH